MAYERSEGFFAGAALMSTTELDAATANETTLMTFYNKCKAMYDSTAVVGDTTVKNGFGRKMVLDTNWKDDDKQKFWSDIVVAISATKSLRSFLATGTTYNKEFNLTQSSVPDNIYLTGNNWPGEVSDLKFKHDNMDDYNSSDVIARYDKLYVGISLKKKPKPADADPTMINKAFDTLLDSNQNGMGAIKIELQNARRTFFANVIRQELTGTLSGVALIPGPGHTEEKPNLINPRTATDEQLWNAKIPIKKTGVSKMTYIPLINVKDLGSADTQWSDPAMVNPDVPAVPKDAMRKAVNKHLGKVNDTTPNTLYQAFLKVVKANQTMFADKLINIVLKRDLQDELTEYSDKHFEFVLTTGIGNVSIGANGMNISSSSGNCIGIDSVALALLYLKKQPKTIVINSTKTKSSKAAKLYFTLTAGKTNLLDLELRYKGDFKPQPQFQATLHSDFKQLVAGEGKFANALKTMRP